VFLFSLISYVHVLFENVLLAFGCRASCWDQSVLSQVGRACLQLAPSVCFNHGSKVCPRLVSEDRESHEWGAKKGTGETGSLAGNSPTYFLSIQ
jgi:hypothetical protein